MNTENGTSPAVNSTESTAQVPAKKAVAKKAPVKKAPVKKAPAKKAAPAKKLVAQAPAVEVLKAPNMAEAIKAINKAERRRGVIMVGGKKYAYTRRSTWAISKNLVSASEAGLIMVVEEEGYYVYPKAKFAELFSKIFKSETYKNIGIYSQSTLPQWHNDYFTAKK